MKASAKHCNSSTSVNERSRGTYVKACDLCKRRKVGCTSEKPCRPCNDSGRECTWVSESGQRSCTAQDVMSLKERIDVLDGHVASLQSELAQHLNMPSGPSKMARLDLEVPSTSSNVTSDEESLRQFRNYTRQTLGSYVFQLVEHLVEQKWREAHSASLFPSSTANFLREGEGTAGTSHSASVDGSNFPPLAEPFVPDFPPLIHSTGFGYQHPSVGHSANHPNNSSDAAVMGEATHSGNGMPIGHPLPTQGSLRNMYYGDFLPVSDATQTHGHGQTHWVTQPPSEGARMYPPF